MGKWSLERDDGRDNPEVALRSVVVKNGDRHCMGRGLQGYEVNQTQILELSQGIKDKGLQTESPG